MLAGDSVELRKARGAFFTPYPIAQFLVQWALRDGRQSILDPTCGEGVFLLAAADEAARVRPLELFGIDIHSDSLEETERLLLQTGHTGANLLTGDFFDEPSPDQIGARIPFVDAVVGNPPFVRGDVRRRAGAAALAQGVRVSGLASSWAPLLVHASSFLKPDGRIAMVVPAELLSVGYAEPIRQWLRRRFKSVHLVLFDRLQFHDAEEQVILLVAQGTGGCSAFNLHEVNDAEELQNLHVFDAEAFTPRDTGKWTELLVPDEVRGILRNTKTDEFHALENFGRIELGTVTGANKFFTLSEATRVEYNLTEGKHVRRTVPPGSRHLTGLRFTAGQWEQLRLKGERVWLLDPAQGTKTAGGFGRYVALGKQLEVDQGYKCSGRTPWWRPPVQGTPDMFFTYMSHVTPRLIANEAGTSYVNSMHGLTLREDVHDTTREALPFVMLNTLTMLSAEITGRSYGGGILKMEPREASQLIVPAEDVMRRTWDRLKDRHHELDQLVRTRNWSAVTDIVDEALLVNTLGIAESDLRKLRAALKRQRLRRQRRENVDGSER
jgi:methylase of polypeptide subunit release factors